MLRPSPVLSSVCMSQGAVIVFSRETAEDVTCTGTDYGRAQQTAVSWARTINVFMCATSVITVIRVLQLQDTKQRFSLTFHTYHV